MNMQSLLLALSGLQAVMAGTLFTDLIITDVDQGPGACIRMPQYTTNTTAPVTDLTSTDIACGYNGTFGISRVCKVEQGGVLSFKFQQYPDSSQAEVLDSGQKGPCSVYMKYVDSAIGDAGAGNGWFKVYEEGYDKNSSQWCTDTLREHSGLLSIAVPTELAGGYYLVRPELMTLQQGLSTPSFYTGCAQIFLDSSETTLPKDLVSIPGYIQAGDPTLQFDISAPALPYTVPGPKIYVSDISPTIQHPSLPFQNVGVLPPGTVLTNANWFGIELSSYSTAEGCQNATASCYNQSTACLSMAGPIGIANCNIWISKCETVESNCNSGSYIGPPDEGKNLNPTPSSVFYANTHAASAQPSSIAISSPTAPASVTSISDLASGTGSSVLSSPTSKPPPSTMAILSSTKSAAPSDPSTSLVYTVDATSLSTALEATSSTFTSTPAPFTSASGLTSVSSLIFSTSTKSASSTRTPTSIASIVAPASASSISLSTFSTLLTPSASNTLLSNTNTLVSTSASSVPFSTLSTIATPPTSSSINVESTSVSSTPASQTTIVHSSFLSSTSPSTLPTTSNFSMPRPFTTALSTGTSVSLSSTVATASSAYAPSLLSSPTISAISSAMFTSLSGTSSAIPTAFTSSLSPSALTSTPSSFSSVLSLSVSVPNAISSTSSLATATSWQSTLASTPVPPPSSSLVISPITSSSPDVSSTTAIASSTGAASRSTVLELTTIIETPSSDPSPSAAASGDAAAYTPPPGAKVSPDGTCGPEKGYTCMGTQEGPCCSSNGYCGTTDDYCGKMYCQPMWGHCDTTARRGNLMRHRHRHLGLGVKGRRS